MRVSIAVFEVPEKTVKSHRRWDFTHVSADSTSSRGDLGCAIRLVYRYERSGLCFLAKGDPHEGHLRPEMVSLVPLALRKGIILETRSVSFLIRAG